MVCKVLGLIISLPLIFILPGYAAVKSRLFSSWRMSWIEEVILVVVLSTSVTSLIALLLAETGLLKIWLLDLILLAITLLVRFVFGNNHSPLMLSGLARWEFLIIAIVVIAAALMFFYPSEWVTGDGDPGMYFNIGYHLSEEGSITVYEESVPEMSDVELNMFYLNGIGQFTPFHLRDRATGRIQPLLFHLFPVWIGLFIMLFGTWGGLYLTSVFALLGILTLYAIARRFSGVVAAGVGSLLAILFFSQVWFSRFAVSEIFVQFFILASLLSFMVFLKTRGILVGVASALAITAAAMARPEAVMVIVPILIILGIEILRGRYGLSGYVLANTMVLGLICYGFYIRYPVYYYFYGNTMRLVGLPRTQQGMSTFMKYYIIAVAVVFVFFNLWILHRLLIRLGKYLKKTFARHKDILNTAARGALALLTLATFIYFYFSSPPLEAGVSPRQFLYQTSIFFGGVAIFVFVVGFCLLVFEIDLMHSLLLSTVVVVYTIVFNRAHVTGPYLPWLSRRFMSVVIPLLFVGLCYMLAKLWSQKRLRLMFRAAAAAIPIGFLILFSVYAAPIVTFVEYEGVNTQLEELAAQLGDSVVIFSEKFTRDVYGIPLRYQHGVDARALYKWASASEMVGIIEKYRDSGRQVLLETTGVEASNIDPQLAFEVTFEEAFGYRFSYPRLDRTYGSRPQQTREGVHNLSFARLETSGVSEGDGTADAGVVDEFEIKMGTGEEIYLSNFYALESVKGTPYRWTKGVTPDQEGGIPSVVIPLGSSEEDIMVEIYVRLHWRPESAPDPDTRLYVNDQPADTEELNGGRLLRTVIEPEDQRPNSQVVQIRSIGYKPIEHGETDKRFMGIIVTGIKAYYTSP